MTDASIDTTSHRRGRLPVALAVLLVWAVLGPGAARAQQARGPSPLGQHFGFLPLEIFKLELRSSNLIAADIDRDGLVDLVLVDNSHSRIDYLKQRKQKPAAADEEPVDDDDDVNQVKSDWRFEHRKISVDKQVSALVIGDFNGDDRPDLAYLARPDRLIVRFQPVEGEWTGRVQFRVPDIQPARGNLAVGDLDGDGRDDLVVVGKDETYLFYQSKKGKLATAKLLMNTSPSLFGAKISDIDGDGRADLCYSIIESQQRSFCARLQDSTGRLGPELQFELPQHRDVQLANLDGRRGDELLVVETQTNRIKLMRMRTAAGGDEAQPSREQRLIQYGFGRRGAGRSEQLRDVATGDIDGDGRIDVVVSDPEGARTIVFRQRPTGGLDLGQAFPGLLDTRHLRIGNVDGKKGNELVVVSVKEKTLGLSRMKDGRLSFPEALPVSGEPVACELVDLDGDGRPEIVYLAKSDKGGEYKLAALAAGKAGDAEQFAPRPFGKQAEVPVTLKGEPVYLLSLDANRDGRPDLLVFQDLEQPPVLLATAEDGSLKVVTAKGGIQLGDINPGQLFTGRENSPSILVAQGKFARSMVLTPGGAWNVLDQYNAIESNAKIAGVAALDLDPAPGKEIVLIDTGVKRLRLMRRESEGKLFQPWREVELGTMVYRSTRIADLDGDKRDDLLLMGDGRFAVLYNGRRGPRLEEMASYEPKRKQAVFATTVTGDLNGDGRKDVAVIDRAAHRISLLDLSASHGLRHALDFKVFEQKAFRGQQGGGSEPREAIVADVTGDGRPDLVLLVHDRVLVYPQDRGVKPPPKPGAKAKAKAKKK